MNKQLHLDSTNYLRNVLNLSIFLSNSTFNELRKAINKTDWLYHSKVNVHYYPHDNSIGKLRYW